MFKLIEPQKVEEELIEHMVESDVIKYINLAYLSSQTHIELWANEKPEDVKKEGKGKQLAKGKIPVGEK